MIIEAGFLSWGRFPSWKTLDRSQQASGGSLDIVRLCCSPFSDFFTEIFPAARAAPGIVPGTGRVFSAISSSPTPDFPAGCTWSRRCPAGREGGGRLLPSFPYQFSPGKGNFKLRWKAEGKDAPKSRSRERKVRKSEGAVGFWEFGMVGGGQGSFAFPGESSHVSLESSIWIIQIRVSSPFPREGKIHLIPALNFNLHLQSLNNTGAGEEILENHMVWVGFGNILVFRPHVTTSVHQNPKKFWF